MVERLFLAVPWGWLRFVIVVFPDHTHLLFFIGRCTNSLHAVNFMKCEICGSTMVKGTFTYIHVFKTECSLVRLFVCL